LVPRLATSEQVPTLKTGALDDRRHSTTGQGAGGAAGEYARRLKLARANEEKPAVAAGAGKAMRAVPAVVAAGIEKALAPDTSCSARCTSSTRPRACAASEPSPRALIAWSLQGHHVPCVSASAFAARGVLAARRAQATHPRFLDTCAVRCVAHH